jgi:phosphoesterase RecJ-like protein
MANRQAVLEAIEQSRRVMICSHVDPDGDSIGSQLAIAGLLRDLGKEVAIVNQDPVPSMYKFLDSQEQIRDKLPRGFQPDTAVILDCSSVDRLGTVQDLLSPGMAIITIDHHPSLPRPNDPAYLEPSASSTGELIVDLFKDLAVPIGWERAVQLYTAILTDTGGFRFPNTSAKCLAAAAELAAQGVKPNAIAHQIYEQLRKSTLKLLSRALSKIEVLENNRICIVCLEQRDLDACQACSEETQGIVEHLLSLKNCLVGVLLREVSPGMVKVSLRTREPVRANTIAQALGGGGHPNAAGYRTEGSLSEAREQALQEISKWL